MDQVLTRLEIETSINRTIDEVERLIKAEPSLPRLSRSQIVDILHNITSSDIDSYEESVEKARSDYQKALMVVLPYNSKDTHGGDLKDLYTKPPMVQVIPDSEGMLPFASIQEELPTTQLPLDNLISEKYFNKAEKKFELSGEDESFYYVDESEPEPEKFSFNSENINSTKPKSVTDKPRVEIIYSTSVTERAKTTGGPDHQGFRPTMPTKKTTENILSSDQWTYYAPPLVSTTSHPATSKRPSISRSTLSTTMGTRKPIVTTTKRPSTLSTTASTTTTTRTTPPTTTRRPTTLSTTTMKRPASTRVTTLSTTQHTTRPPKSSQIQNKPAPFLPTVITKTSSEQVYPPLKKSSEEVYPPFKKLPSTTTTKKPQDMSSLEFLTDYPTSAPKLSEKKMPPVFKKLPTTTVEPEAMQFDLSSMMGEERPARPVYVTPMEAAKNIPRPTPELPKTSSGVREEIANLLATIGLRPNKERDESKSKPSTLSNEVILTKDFAIPESNSVYPRYTGGLASGEIESPSIIGQDTFNNGPNDLRYSASNLTPDVQQLLQRFGVQLPASQENKPTKTTTTTTTTTTTSKPTTVRSMPQKNSWNMFIPVPTSIVKDESMKNFLAKFGLGVPETRQEKSMKKNTRSSMSSVIDAVPNNMKDILENIGLITRAKSPPKPKTQTTTTTTTTTTEEPGKLHIFKPHESLVDNAKQRVKINQLLDTVKLVQEGKADVYDVRKAANELLKHTKTLPGGPDLLSLEEILKNYNEDTKNDVKRQELQAMADSMDMASSGI